MAKPSMRDNILVRKLIEIVEKYYQVVMRDICTSDTLMHIYPNERDHVQIGHKDTLRYISFPRSQTIATREFIEGFIEAAKKKDKSYNGYMFKE